MPNESTSCGTKVECMILLISFKTGSRTSADIGSMLLATVSPDELETEDDKR
jgi:hypothetical protein